LKHIPKPATIVAASYIWEDRVKRSNKALIAVAIGAIVAVAAFAATGFAGAESSRIELIAGPVPFVEEGGDGFTIAKLVNVGPSTVTQAVLHVDLTSTPLLENVHLDPADPSCTVTTNTGFVRVSCDLPQVPAPGTETRVIRWKAPAVSAATALTISSRLAYKNDPNNDSTVATDVNLKILNGSDGPANEPGEVDVDSTCSSPSGPVGANTGQLPTVLDPQTSTLGYGATALGFPCNWAVAGETGVDPAAKCGSATTPCLTGFWFASLPDALGTLTLSIYELPKSSSLSKFVLREFLGYPTDVTNSQPVPLCVNLAPPAGRLSCEVPNSREKLGSRGAIFHLFVQGTGRDPGYAG
jgi:hypothetical protein